mmetsp:Transcript_16806/g.23505  ORF Transcript_16806/g.23505 Transcript_16806/m.23505 type:complete len:445 (+) Transcript_16806:67-1401(+)
MMMEEEEKEDEEEEKEEDTKELLHHYEGDSGSCHFPTGPRSCKEKGVYDPNRSIGSTAAYAQFTLRKGETEECRFVSFSSDGSMLAIASESVISIWSSSSSFSPSNSSSPRPFFTRIGKIHAASSLLGIVFSPAVSRRSEERWRQKSGKTKSLLLATASGSETEIFTVPDVKKIVLSPRFPSSDVKFSPDGCTLIAISGGYLRSCSLANGQSSRLFFQPSSRSFVPMLKDFSFSPDGGELLVGYGRAGIDLWNMGRLRKSSSDVFPMMTNVHQILWSEIGVVLTVGDKGLLASTSDSIGITCSGAKQSTLWELDRAFQSVVLSACGRMIALSYGHTGEIRDVRTGRLLETFSLSSCSEITDLAFSPSDAVLATAHNHGVTIFRYDKGNRNYSGIVTTILRDLPMMRMIHEKIFFAISFEDRAKEMLHIYAACTSESVACAKKIR